MITRPACGHEDPERARFCVHRVACRIRAAVGAVEGARRLRLSADALLAGTSAA